MKLELFVTWVALSTGCFIYQSFGGHHWVDAFQNSYWMGIALGLAAYRLRHYRTA